MSSPVDSTSNPSPSPSPVPVNTAPPATDTAIPPREPTNRQHALLAVARRAITSPERAVLLHDVAGMLAEVLRAEYGAVAEVETPDDAFHWHWVAALEEDRSPAISSNVPRDPQNSLAGYTLSAAHPVMVENLAKEQRFNDLFLRKHAVQSAVALPLIVGTRSFGCLAACSIQPEHFNEDDLLFTEMVAHLVASTIARGEVEATLAEERRLAAGVLQTVDAIVLVLNGAGQITRINPSAERLTGFALSDLRQRSLDSVFAVPQEVDLFRNLPKKLQQDTSVLSLKSSLLTKQGTERRIAWSFRGLFDQNGTLEMIIASGIEIPEPEPASTYPTPWLPGVNTERRKTPRRSYPYKQMIGYVQDGNLPKRNEFVEIQCNDIAAEGFSYIDRTPPLSDTVVIALGVAPKLTFLIAQVAHVTRIEFDGRQKFLIGCNYTGRASY